MTKTSSKFGTILTCLLIVECLLGAFSIVGRASFSSISRDGKIQSGSHYYAVISADTYPSFYISYTTSADSNLAVRCSIRVYTASGSKIAESTTTSDCTLPHFCKTLYVTVTTGAKYYVEIAYIKGSDQVSYTLQGTGSITSLDDLGTTTPAGLPPPPSPPFNPTILAWLLPLILIPVLIAILVVYKRKTANARANLPPEAVVQGEVTQISLKFWCPSCNQEIKKKNLKPEDKILVPTAESLQKTRTCPRCENTLQAFWAGNTRDQFLLGALGFALFIDLIIYGALGGAVQGQSVGFYEVMIIFTVVCAVPGIF